jgi:hypothetical protein
MYRPSRSVVLRTAEDLADARQLRAQISSALEETPIDEHKLRCAVWTFVGPERRAGVPPAVVITRLAGLIDASRAVPVLARADLTRQVILWCVESYFGYLSGDVLDESFSPSLEIPELVSDR